MISRIKNIKNSLIRSLKALGRPSRRTNMRLLKERGERIDSIIIREASVADIPALGVLHSITWAQTYAGVRRPPTAELREHQWRQQFEAPDKNWFCLVVENQKGKLIGFAKGQTYSHSHLPQFSGELNKIYLLREYHRLGLGRKLVCRVARRFLSMGITNMVLFGIPQNPTCYFHEAMGGQRLISKKGTFDGGYGWMDLNKLATRCPAE
jgi:L-amino acid N-acyltransferase YncA